MLNLKFTGAAGFEEGLKLVLPILPLTVSDSGIPVTVEQGDCLTARLTEAGGLIRYSKKVEFFRALSILCQHGVGCDVTEKRAFAHSGVMLDLTNNNVQKPESLEAFFARMALMGLDTAILKQLMKVEEYPVCSYLREPYTFDEMKQIDETADSLGIEAIPFIDTLNHLFRDLWWSDWCSLMDTTGIAFVGEEKTNAYLEARIKAASAPYRTNRIHLGIDLSGDIGRSRYLRKHGFRETADIVSDHVGYMEQIVKKLGLTGIMWADVYVDVATSDEVRNAAPSDMELIYRAKNARPEDLKTLSGLPAHKWYAAAGCTDFGPAPRYDLTIEPMVESLQACRKNGVEDVLVYLEGSDGAECSLLTGLYQLQVLAETDYTGNAGKDHVKARFAACASADADAFLGLDGFNVMGDVTGSPCKFLLYEDLLVPLFEKDCEGYRFSEDYAVLQKKCEAWRDENPAYAQMFDFYGKLAAALSKKCAWHEQAGEVIRRKDRAAAKTLAAAAPAAVYALRALKDAWRELWYATRKAAGYEVIDLRLGALVQRMESAGRRMNLFADGKVDDIEELSAAKLPLATYKDGKIGMVTCWKDITTPSSLM